MLLFTLTAAAWLPSVASAARSQPCARWATGDLLCRDGGDVANAAPSVEEPVYKSIRRPVLLPPNTRVRVGAGGSARMSFGKQARCSFGTEGVATLFTTRYVDVASQPVALYQQRSGRSDCLHFGRRDSTNYLCKPSRPCPFRVEVTGYAATKARIGPSVRIAQTSDEQVVVTMGTLDFCAEDFTVSQYDSSGSGASIGGGGSSEIDGVKYVSHERVMIKETVVTRDGFVSTDTEIRGVGDDSRDCRVPSWATRRR